ncbi:hypothetical protein [Longispora urticae]
MSTFEGEEEDRLREAAVAMLGPVIRHLVADAAGDRRTDPVRWLKRWRGAVYEVTGVPQARTTGVGRIVAALLAEGDKLYLKAVRVAYGGRRGVFDADSAARWSEDCLAILGRAPSRAEIAATAGVTPQVVRGWSDTARRNVRARE